MESKEEPEAEREVTTEEFAGGTEALFRMENLSLVSSHSQVELSYSYRIKICRSAWKKNGFVTLQDAKLFNLNDEMTLL